MSRKKIELENCPICGGKMEIIKWDPPEKKTKPFVIEGYSLWCGFCGLHFGWELKNGGMFDPEEEAARVWNSGQAFKYRRMWEKLCITLSGLTERVNHCAISKKDLIIGIKATMENIEEEAFRGAAEDGEQ